MVSALQAQVTVPQGVKLLITIAHCVVEYSRLQPPNSGKLTQMPWLAKSIAMFGTN